MRPGRITKQPGRATKKLCRDALVIASRLGAATSLVLVMAVAIGLPEVARAQVGADGSLSEFPFALPFDPVASPDADDRFVRIGALGYDACVAHFQDAFRAGTPLSPEWTVGGQGFDVDSQSWHFGVLHRDRTLYHLSVARDAIGCRVELEFEASPVPGGRWRWSYPSFDLGDGTTVQVDGFVVGD